jgi:hypothetical protein
VSRARGRLFGGQQHQQQELLPLPACRRGRRCRRIPRTTAPPAGPTPSRIEMVLFTDTSPRHAENFRQLCTGEGGGRRERAGAGGAMLGRAGCWRA